MIGMTGVLGWLAIGPTSASAPIGDASFLVLMVILTAVLAAAIVVRPIRWTLDEVRFAVGAPAVFGGLAVLAGIVLGGRAPATGGSTLPGDLVLGGAALLVLAAVAYVAFSLGGRRGLGPLARVRAGPADDPDPPADPPDQGWLIPGGAPRRAVAHRPGLLHLRPARGLRHQLHAVDRSGQPVVHRLPAGPHRPDAPGPPDPDVQLPQRPARLAPRLVALVGLAVRLQAGLVLPAGLRQRHHRHHLRRRQPGDLLAGCPGHGLGVLAGLGAAEPGPHDPGHRLRLPVAVLVAHRPGELPVPLLHGAALPLRRPGLLAGRAVARALAAHLAAGAPRGGRGARGARRSCG